MAGIERAGTHGEITREYGRPTGDALWTALTTACLVVVPILLAILVDSAFLFVSLGPIIFELVERPLAPASAPRSVIFGNGIALLAGYGALAVFGLRTEPSTMIEGVTLARGLAVLLALAATGAVLAAIRAMHPPAGATVLLVSLGVITSPPSLAIIFAGVVLTTLLAWLMNHAAGIPMPAWSPRESS